MLILRVRLWILQSVGEEDAVVGPVRLTRRACCLAGSQPHGHSSGYPVQTSVLEVRGIIRSVTGSVVGVGVVVSLVVVVLLVGLEALMVEMIKLLILELPVVV